MSGHIEVMSARDLPHVDVVRLQPGDVLVMHLDTHLSDEEYEHVKANFAERFPGHELVVMELGAKLSVVRRENT